ncbi:MAG TPA: TetR family transcriptional regulator [Longimicrobiaceae bacterium]|nr:TetR family transcriptional regulator [Longimicrobiaceae bacterium]
MGEGTAGAARTARGAQTRALILETALELFRERGYEDTTMRAIAERAGVALGSAYYYFRSKEELVQSFYGRMHREHVQASARVLRTERALRERLLGVMRARLETMEPYHRFAGVLFRTAADPRSPLNPFSEASRAVREENTALFAEVVRGARDGRVPAELAAELPELLWTYSMGITLFWIHDDSPGRARTHRLTERTVDLVVQLVKLASLAPLRPLRASVLGLLAELRAPTAPAPGDTPAAAPPPPDGPRRGR